MIRKLTKEELKDLTDRSTYPAQVRRLRELGIRFRVTADRTIVVLPEEVRRALMGEEKSQVVVTTEPDWSALERHA